MLRIDKKYHKVNKKAIGNYYSVHCCIDGYMLRATFDMEYVLSNKYLTRQEVEAQAIVDLELEIKEDARRLKCKRAILKELREE